MNSVEEMIERLEKQKAQIETAIESLRGLQDLPNGSTTRATNHERLPRVEQTRTRAPTGLLKEVATKKLAAAKSPLSVAELRDRIATDYPYGSKQSLYAAVFNLVGKNAEFKKTKEGVVLASSESKPTKKSKKK